MRAWFILFLAIASEVVGTIALKYAVDHFWIYGVAALCFILAFVLLHRVMQEGVNVGVAYGLWASGGVISTALLSAALFGEARCSKTRWHRAHYGRRILRGNGRETARG